MSRALKAGSLITEKYSCEQIAAEQPLPAIEVSKLLMVTMFLLFPRQPPLVAVSAL